MTVVHDGIRADLLHAIAQVACAATGGRSASVALCDHMTDELVFVAVAGEGEDAGELLGGRFGCDVGYAGQVFHTGASIEVHDLWHQPRFAREIAAEVGAEPDAIAVVPIVHGGAIAGVLSVLDPGDDPLPALMTLAAHATAALDVCAALART
jgi:GAF domain-containing protein